MVRVLSDTRPTDDAPQSPPALEAVVGAVVTLWGLIIGLRPISDNSFFTHLATGRRLIDSGGVPAHDPYTFTAHGRAWTVQSWLASLLYGVVDHLAGLRGEQLLTGALCAALAALTWRLSRGSLVHRLALVLPAMAVADGYWAARPFLIALLALGVVGLIGRGEVDPRWLIALMWMWVNVHGSFPFALVLLVTMAVGQRLDGADSPARRALPWAVGGTLAGAIGPLGPKILIFPFHLLGGAAVARIAEWKAPTWVPLWQKAFLVLVALVIVLVSRRPRWSAVVPLAVFVPLGLYSTRNLVVAALVVVIALGGDGSGGTVRREVFRPALVGIGAVGIVMIAAAFGHRPVSVQAYPLEALRVVDSRHGLNSSTRLVAPDIVGNYLELAYRGKVPTFFDDRAELFDTAFVNQVGALYDGGPTALDVLDDFRHRYGIQAVLWYRERPLGALLAASDRWHVVFSDEHWILAEPR